MYFSKRYLDELRDWRSKTDERMSDIEHNYLSRFENLNQRLGKIELMIQELQLTTKKHGTE